VYVDGSASDPAMQHAWRLQLAHALDDAAARLDPGSDELHEFKQCRRKVERSIESGEAGLTPGWAAFATAIDNPATFLLPIATPTLVVWAKGAALGPYLRAQKRTRDVVVAIADARHATLYQYHDAVLERAQRVRSHHPIEHADHLGAPARNGFHTGTRGRTGRDAAQRALHYGRDRMLAQAAASIAKLVEPDGWVLVAGVDAVVSKLIARMNGLAPGRVGRVEGIDVHSSEAEIAEAAAMGAAALSAAFDMRHLAEVAEASGAGGLGVFGAADTDRALRQRCVRTLYVTPSYAGAHPAETREAIQVALDQHATVEEVDREAASMLDERGGVAAGLRFRPAVAEPLVLSSATG
jgi:hypothetical protein